MFLLANVQKSFEDPDGDYNYVINLAAETKYSQSEAVKSIHTLPSV